MTKEAFYFSHDSNARHDPKILALRSVYGLEGYGRYWVLIEMLREQSDYKLKKTKHLFNALAMQMQCDSNAVHSFVSDCINEFELLQEDDDFIWCNSLIKRMKIKDERSEKARKAAEARWGKPNNDNDFKVSKKDDSQRNASAMQTHSERNAIKEKKEKKVNKNISRQKNYDESSPYLKLAKKLNAAIKNNLPDYKNPNLQSWADDFRKLIEIDNRDFKNIVLVIDWVQNNSFWWKNVMSAAKLRKQYDRLLAEMKSEKQPKKTKSEFNLDNVDPYKDYDFNKEIAPNF